MMAEVGHLLLVCPRADVLGKLLGLPVAVTVVHRPGADVALERACALHVVEADFTDPAALLAAVRPVHESRPVDAVLGLTELSLLPAAAVARQLGARGNSPDTVRCAQDKAAMRARLAASGAGRNAHRVCSTVQDAAEFAREHPGGIVLKPVDGNGGTGVHVVRDPDELAAAWTWTTTATAGWDWSEDAGRKVAVLAEQYLTGAEFSVETLSVEGRHQVLAVTRKQTAGPPHFVEMGHELPAVLPPAEASAIAGAALRALDAIGYAWGPAHTEVILAEDGCATVVEINARQGGDQIWELVQLATGSDMIVGAVLALARAELPPVAPQTRVGGAAIRYVAAEPGEVVAVQGVAAALAVEGVIRVGELREPGDTVPALGDSWARSGWVLAAGCDTATAAAAADRAAALVSVCTRQPRPAQPAEAR